MSSRACAKKQVSELSLKSKVGNQGRRPADARVFGLLEAGTVDVDFGVVHPLQPSGSLAEVEPGKLAHDTAQRKKTASAALCQREGTFFEAFIVETFGTWDGGALRLTQALVRATALHRSCSLLEAARQGWFDIYISL